MKNVSEKIVENNKAQIKCPIHFFPHVCLAVSGTRKRKKKTPCFSHALYIFLNCCGLQSGLVGIGTCAERQKEQEFVGATPIHFATKFRWS